MTSNNTLEQPYPRPLSGAEVSQLPPALIPARAPLEGRYVRLEPMDAALHAEALYRAGHDDEAALGIWDYMVYGPWPDVDSYRQTLRQQSASQDPMFYALRSLDTGQIGGQVSFLNINALHGTIEIGHIWFSPQLQKTRAATEALCLMIRHAMDDLGYRRMEWKCNALNEGSRNAARRLGFRFEGVFYNHLIFKGKNRDTAWYSILDSEWPTLRAIMQDWLSLDNFDSNGLAKTSLSAATLNHPDRV
ncbi:GNAT family N-acetyltransferase [Aestuariirhabdus sp. Z084]|uniref:GNAT family N-acetyltransferase n=1 Tax=Aestuariirhabdus haliotis TaxID=2918751 RepID=UPI00201B368B|nr:GNAT family protein [Aestuariirhabdus haliotis]MCL6417825.1 GNAT family N-acetyltransferase [Aestuariirhabdus haliotis]MCL6421741.1 GNAT family N-acetyltransferase [Aestuariirhabdus haliotis]